MDYVAIVSIITVFGFAFLVVLVVMICLHLNNRNKCRVMEAAINHGRELPESFFGEDILKKKEPTPESRLLTGLIWIAVGVGLVVTFIFTDYPKGIGLGAIPLLVGVAFLIVYFVSRPKSGQQKDDQQA